MQYGFPLPLTSLNESNQVSSFSEASSTDIKMILSYQSMSVSAYFAVS